MLKIEKMENELNIIGRNKYDNILEQINSIIDKLEVKYGKKSYGTQPLYDIIVEYEREYPNDLDVTNCKSLMVMSFKIEKFASHCK